MILTLDLQPIGTLVKTHGTAGELVAVFDAEPIDTVLNALRCVFVEIEGLPVPFFIASVRSRGASSRLLRLDGIGTQEQAAELASKTIYAEARQLPQDDDADHDADGFYAEDLVGFTATDAALGTPLGTIQDIDLSTANALFIIAAPDGRQLLVPIADEFITDIDAESRSIALSLPQGLLDI